MASDGRAIKLESGDDGADTRMGEAGGDTHDADDARDGLGDRDAAPQFILGPDLADDRLRERMRPQIEGPYKMNLILAEQWLFLRSMARQAETGIHIWINKLAETHQRLLDQLTARRGGVRLHDASQHHSQMDSGRHWMELIQQVGPTMTLRDGQRLIEDVVECVIADTAMQVQTALRGLNEAYSSLRDFRSESNVLPADMMELRDKFVPQWADDAVRIHHADELYYLFDTYADRTVKLNNVLHAFKCATTPGKNDIAYNLDYATKMEPRFLEMSADERRVRKVGLLKQLFDDSEVSTLNSTRLLDWWQSLVSMSAIEARVSVLEVICGAERLLAEVRKIVRNIACKVEAHEEIADQEQREANLDNLPRDGPSHSFGIGRQEEEPVDEQDADTAPEANQNDGRVSDDEDRDPADIFNGDGYEGDEQASSPAQARSGSDVDMTGGSERGYDSDDTQNPEYDEGDNEPEDDEQPRSHDGIISIYGNLLPLSARECRENMDEWVKQARSGEEPDAKMRLWEVFEFLRRRHSTLQAPSYTGSRRNLSDRLYKKMAAALDVLKPREGGEKWTGPTIYQNGDCHTFGCPRNIISEQELENLMDGDETFVEWEDMEQIAHHPEDEDEDDD